VHHEGLLGSQFGDEDAESDFGQEEEDPEYLSTGPLGALTTPSIYYTPFQTPLSPGYASEELVANVTPTPGPGNQAGPSSHGCHHCDLEDTLRQYKFYFGAVKKQRIERKIAQGKRRERMAEKYLEQYK
jgi:hypothetical protein